jgi:hypothetical protein
VTAIESPGKQDERKKHYRIIDDDTIIRLKKYYKLDDNGELLKFVKRNIKSDVE